MEATMAEMEKVEFEFPHEKEEKSSREGSKVVASSKENPDELQENNIEIVDDAPPEDRNRKPMTEPPKDMTDDELEKYDEGVKARIRHFTKGYHDERRRAEEAIREREAAIDAAQRLVEENRKLKGSVNQGQTALLEQAKKVVNNELEAAKRAYKEAYESGDAEALVAAQEAFTTVKIKADKIANFRAPAAVEQKEPEIPVSAPVQQQRLDEHTEKWKNDNNWFGRDRRMTSYALALHQEIVEDERINPSSSKYFERIDEEMRKRFPEKFDEPRPDAPPPAKSSNVVAPATRNTASKKIVLSKSQVNIAKRLGLKLEDYAREVARTKAGE
jgi:hypothetical protein